MTITVQLTGFKELADALKDLPQNIAKNHLRSAVSAAAMVVRNEAKVLAPVDTGTLRRSMYIKQIFEKCGPTKQVYYVGARQGRQYREHIEVTKGGKVKKVKNQDAFYARFVEFGHFTRRPGGRLRKTNRGQANNQQLADEVQAGKVRWVAPQPFLRPAFYNKQSAAIEAMKAKLKARIEEYRAKR